MLKWKSFSADFSWCLFIELDTELFHCYMVLLIFCFHQKDWMKSVPPSSESPWSFCLCRNSVTVSHMTSCVLYITSYCTLLCWIIITLTVTGLYWSVSQHCHWRLLQYYFVEYCVYLYLHCNFDKFLICSIMAAFFIIMPIFDMFELNYVPVNSLER